MLWPPMVCSMFANRQCLPLFNCTFQFALFANRQTGVFVHLLSIICSFFNITTTKLGVNNQNLYYSYKLPTPSDPNDWWWPLMIGRLPCFWWWSKLIFDCLTIDEHYIGFTPMVTAIDFNLCYPSTRVIYRFTAPECNVHDLVDTFMAPARSKRRPACNLIIGQTRSH